MMIMMMMTRLLWWPLPSHDDVTGRIKPSPCPSVTRLTSLPSSRDNKTREAFSKMEFVTDSQHISGQNLSSGHILNGTTESQPFDGDSGGETHISTEVYKDEMFVSGKSEITSHGVRWNVFCFGEDNTCNLSTSTEQRRQTTACCNWMDGWMWCGWTVRCQ